MQIKIIGITLIVVLLVGYFLAEWSENQPKTVRKNKRKSNGKKH